MRKGGPLNESAEVQDAVKETRELSSPSTHRKGAHVCETCEWWL